VSSTHARQLLQNINKVLKEYRMVFHAGLRDPCVGDVVRLSTYPIGKGFQMSWYSRKNGFVDLFSSAKCFVGCVFCFALVLVQPGRKLAIATCGVFFRTAKSMRKRSHT
jgi:hypothetical protein